MTKRDRDLSVEQWLRQTPVAGARSESTACLDAETLAAWAEGVLDGADRASAEAHASSCARCQAMLAVMVRTMPGPAPRPESPIRKWLMMLSPVMATGAAVALWFAVDQRPPAATVDTLMRDQQVAGRLSESTAAPAAAPAEAKDTRIGGDASGVSRDREAPKPDRAAAAPTDTRKERDADRADKNTALTLAKAKAGNERKDEAAAAASAPAALAALEERVQVVTGTPAVQSRPAPPPAPQQQAGQMQQSADTQNQVSQRQQAGAPPAEALRERQIQERQSQRPAASPVPEPAVANAAGRGGATGGVADSAFGFRKNTGSFDVASPDASARWRVVDGRIVQRSLDAGATWAQQYSAEESVILAAGAAPSPTVCWLVGRAGAIVLTTDGKGWRRVAFPEPVDLVAVTSTDARTATVKTANGRTLATTDAGRTWTPR